MYSINGWNVIETGAHGERRIVTDAREVNGFLQGRQRNQAYLCTVDGGYCPVLATDATTDAQFRADRVSVKTGGTPRNLTRCFRHA